MAALAIAPVTPPSRRQTYDFGQGHGNDFSSILGRRSVSSPISWADRTTTRDDDTATLTDEKEERDMERRRIRRARASGKFFSWCTIDGISPVIVERDDISRSPSRMSRAPDSRRTSQVISTSSRRSSQAISIPRMSEESEESREAREIQEARAAQEAREAREAREREKELEKERERIRKEEKKRRRGMFLRQWTCRCELM